MWLKVKRLDCRSTISLIVKPTREMPDNENRAFLFFISGEVQDFSKPDVRLFDVFCSLCRFGLDSF